MNGWRQVSAYRRLRIYLDCEAPQHAALASAVILAGSLIWLGDRSLGKQGSDTAEAAGWPSVEARVMSSEVNELNSSDKTTFSTKVCVNAKFIYTLADRSIQSDYVRQWTRNDSRDWAALLKPGNTLKIRVSPTDRNKISLVDHNQIR